MESFLFSEMNKATREKNKKMIKFYGPFAAALSFIIHCGNNRGNDESKVFSVYRGL